MAAAPTAAMATFVPASMAAFVTAADRNRGAGACSRKGACARCGAGESTCSAETETASRDDHASPAAARGVRRIADAAGKPLRFKRPFNS